MNSNDGYNQTMNSNENQEMGGGVGAHGSGVAGGYESNQNQQQTQPAEKQDWLDKGIEMAGKKAGVNIVRLNSKYCASAVAH